MSSKNKIQWIYINGGVGLSLTVACSASDAENIAKLEGAKALETICYPTRQTHWYDEKEGKLHVYIEATCSWIIPARADPLNRYFRKRHEQ